MLYSVWQVVLPIGHPRCWVNHPVKKYRIIQKSHVTWQSKVPQPPLAATNRELNYLSVCDHTADQNLTILCIVASNGFSRPCHSMQQHAQLFAATSRQPDGANNRHEPVDNVRICTSLN